VTEHEPTDYHGTVYFENTTLSARQVADVLHAMADHYPASAFEGLEFGSTDWV